MTTLVSHPGMSDFGPKWVAEPKRTEISPGFIQLGAILTYVGANRTSMILPPAIDLEGQGEVEKSRL